MVAVDTNILVYAHRRDAARHQEARYALEVLAEGNERWGLPWPCIHEFLGVVTHPRVFQPSSTLEEGLEQIEVWRASPAVAMLGEEENYWAVFRALVVTGRIVGPKVHDARIAAICRERGVTELWTADRDFSRFPGLRVVNPLTAARR